jgi:drug/metabolite transporter (DMT)-like permease
MRQPKTSRHIVADPLRSGIEENDVSDNSRERSGYVMAPIHWVLLVVLSVLWGGSFFFNKVTLEQVPQLTVVLCRVGGGAAILWLVIAATRTHVSIDGRTWLSFLLLGFLNNVVPFDLILWGQTQIASGLAAILNATTPVFTTMLAHFFTRDERLTASKITGVIIGVGGVAVLIGPVALSGGRHVLAEVAILGAALCYATAGIYGKRFKSQSALVTAAGQLSASALIVLPLSIIVDRPWMLPPLDLPTIGSLAGIAVVSTAVAYIIYFRILAAAGATNILLVTLLVPVSATLLGTIVLGEHIAARSVGGMVLIALGLLAIDGRLLRKMRPRSAMTGSR